VGGGNDSAPVNIVPVRVVEATQTAIATASGSMSRMEIVLIGGERIIVGADVDASSLARVAKALSRRSSQFAGDDPVREVWSTSAAQSPERAPRPRRCGSDPIDARRPGRACALAMRPLYALIETHVLAAARLPGDDTTVPILAKGAAG